MIRTVRTLPQASNVIQHAIRTANHAHLSIDERERVVQTIGSDAREVAHHR